MKFFSIVVLLFIAICYVMARPTEAPVSEEAAVTEAIENNQDVRLTDTLTLQQFEDYLQQMM